MPPKKTQALVFNHLLCTVIKLFIVICHDSSIPFLKTLVHVDIQRPPYPLGGQAWTFC